MAAMLQPRSRRGVRAEINVTPLVDVVLVLLIVFMVVTPLIAAGKQVDLPVAQRTQDAQPGGARAPLVISVGADRRLWLGSEEISSKELRRRVRSRLSARPHLEIVLQADGQLAVSDVRPLLEQLRNAGARRIGLAVAEPPARPGRADR